ncbi:hypothetical protein ACS5PN_14110 [Roseateles sp. NT4]|uniref:hypothetical protein n=1 Tax=Roseateles sp. NT4 TaxID=3453715 RepID=UPI003EEE7975
MLRYLLSLPLMLIGVLLAVAAVGANGFFIAIVPAVLYGSVGGFAMRSRSLLATAFAMLLWIATLALLSLIPDICLICK